MTTFTTIGVSTHFALDDKFLFCNGKVSKHHRIYDLYSPTTRLFAFLTYSSANCQMATYIRSKAYPFFRADILFVSHASEVMDCDWRANGQ